MSQLHQTHINCTEYITHILCCFSCTNSTQDAVVAGAIQWGICLLHSALFPFALLPSVSASGGTFGLQEAPRQDSRGGEGTPGAVLGENSGRRSGTPGTTTGDTRGGGADALHGRRCSRR
jgi:hypothetical protein